MKNTLKIAFTGVGVGVVSLMGAGLASAHGPGGGGEGQGEILDRVAEILAIDATQLGDALQRAREEHRNAEMDARLEQAVKDGTITQEEAGEIRAWLDLRPEVLDGLKGADGHHGPRHNAGGGTQVERLAELVEEGTITQAEANEVLAWSEDQPEALSEIRPDRPDRGRRGHDRDQGRGFEMRVAPGEDGEIGRFGGFMFRLPPGFNGGVEGGSETPPVGPPSDDPAI